MTLKRLRLRGSTLKPADASAETDAPSGGVVTYGLDRDGRPVGLRPGEVSVRINSPIQIAAADLDAQSVARAMLGAEMSRELDMSLMYGEPQSRRETRERIYRQNPDTAGEPPIDSIAGYSVGLSAERLGTLRYRTFRVETPDGPRVEQRIESQPAGYELRSELPEVQDLMSRAYFGRIYGSLYGVPEEPRTRQDYLVGGNGAGFGWRPSSDVMNYQRYVFRFYAPLLKTAELSDFYRIVENHPNEVSPHLAYALYCASLAKVPRGNRAISDATSFFREVAFYRCPRVIQFYQDPAQPLAEIFGEHMPHHFICGTEGS